MKITKNKAVKYGSKYDFHIYQVKFPAIMRERTVIVLSKDIQSALSTVPQATSITELQGTILVNKAVARDIRDIMQNRRNSK